MEPLLKLENMKLHRKLLHDYLDQVIDLRIRSFYTAPNWKQEDEISKQRMYDEEAKLTRALRLYEDCVTEMDRIYYLITGKKLENESTDA